MAFHFFPPSFSVISHFTFFLLAFLYLVFCFCFYAGGFSEEEKEEAR